MIIAEIPQKNLALNEHEQTWHNSLAIRCMPVSRLEPTGAGLAGASITRGNVIDAG
jgi:hypothetical protein